MTAKARIKRYRERQRVLRNIARVEVQVPRAAAPLVREYARQLRRRYLPLTAEQTKIVDLALGTINAPLPRPISAAELRACLLSETPIKSWVPHVTAFFEELSDGVIHDLVLSGWITFEQLHRAARVWRCEDAPNLPWIREMADLALENAARESAARA